MKLKRASDFIQELPAYRRGEIRSHREGLAAAATAQYVRHIAIDWEHPTGAPLLAHVNQGRWIVQCPYCNGATMAEEGESFFCPDCLMIENAGKPRPVVFPAQAEAIERLLLNRPKEATRNWLPHETVDDLERENLLNLGLSSVIRDPVGWIVLEDDGDDTPPSAAPIPPERALMVIEQPMFEKKVHPDDN